MADIFLSYTHSDRDRVRSIVEMMEDEGWSVWWDRGIEPGMKWLPALTTELANSRCIMVAWSENSVKSKWVQKEARAGLDKGALVPILLDAAKIPEKFAEHQATDLSKWKGERDLTEVQTLFRRLAGLVPPSRIDTVRPGYDPEFLHGHKIPLPGITGAGAVLRYNHFTVVMNPARRLAHYSAYNVDGVQLRHIDRKRDIWLEDPLLPKPLQMEMAVLRLSPYDRGRLAARGKVSWGEDRQASVSARQASYWTNVAPRLADFNRIYWLKLEKLERDVVDAYGRVTGFAGPVFAEDDETFRGELVLDDGVVAVDAFRVPREYWKVIVVASNDGHIKLQAYLMDQVQMVDARLGRNFDLSSYAVSLDTIEQKTRLRFSELLHAARPLEVG